MLIRRRLFSTINTNYIAPKSKGWKMPGEWYPHDACWMLWPHLPNNWRLHAKPAKNAFAQVARAIGQFERVNMCALPALVSEAKSYFGENDNVRVLPLEYDDNWMRDIGPSFLISENGSELGGVTWRTNSWGGIYVPRHDLHVANKVCKLAGTNNIFAPDIVMEGGSFHVDGEGTLLTTEECLLNPNRNPHFSKADIEQRLKDNLGVEKVLWMPKGLVADEDTSGHIDNIACFARPGEVLLSWTDDKSDPQYDISVEALDYLSNIKDAKGRPIRVHKVHIPPPLYYSSAEIAGYEEGRSTSRLVGQRMAASYVNFYHATGGIVAPAYDNRTDQLAMEVFRKVFPGYKIILVPGREIMLGGGNIHCITQQQPRALQK